MGEEKVTEGKEFLVIGAGLSRTGTMSLMYALEILLPGKCYHGFKAIHHEKQWCDIMRGEYSDEEYKDFLLSNYVAGVDAPFCYYYDRAMKLFPNAKVIVTVRDPESWVKSVQSTVINTLQLPYVPVHIFGSFFPKYLTEWSDDKLLNGWSQSLLLACRELKRMENSIQAIQQGTGVEFYVDWLREVESTVPEEKLLKFDVREGWGPLCKHLDLPIPDVPFPKVNSTEAISLYLFRNRRRGWLLLYEFVSIPLFAYGVYKLTR